MPSSVVNVKSPETARLPAASRDRTRKWYSVVADRLATSIVCAVTRLTSSVLKLPYAGVWPYSTSELLTSFVVQVIVAATGRIEDTTTDEMTGGVVSLFTVTATAALVVRLPAASRATAVSVWPAFVAVVVFQDTENG